MIIATFILALLGIILLVISIEEESGGIFFMSLLCGIAIAIMWVMHSPSSPPPDQKQTQQTQTKDDSATKPDDSQQKADPNTDEQKTQADEKTDDQKKDLDFQKWSDDNVKSARVSCTPDGVQVYVIAWLFTDGDNIGTPQTLTVYPRLHQDGKPFLCSEGKDPKEEPKL